MRTVNYLAVFRWLAAGREAAIAGDDQLSQAIENVIYIICDRRHGVDFWDEHEAECVRTNANPVECGENLILKLEGDL